MERSASARRERISSTRIRRRNPRHWSMMRMMAVDGYCLAVDWKDSDDFVCRDRSSTRALRFRRQAWAACVSRLSRGEKRACVCVCESMAARVSLTGRRASRRMSNGTGSLMISMWVTNEERRSLCVFTRSCYSEQNPTRKAIRQD